MSTTASIRQKPEFFCRVQKKARDRWDQLEADPELAGPWKLLFAQVQSPRHVLSELLQNADDAEALNASARIEDGVFIFEHDGKDFDEEQFASLCRFGFSNKRKLHTIGFRGIGFKSVFSMGNDVEVLTPTLAVRFNKRRFSEPIWMDGAPPCRKTTIRVPIQDENRASELRENLEEWALSAVSLMFFNRIRKLVIDGRIVKRRYLREGPIPNSEAIEITDSAPRVLYLFRSPEEPFPPEAIEEISSERNVDDLNLQPCRVEIVVGLSGDARLYVVLPTGVKPGLSFSVNAPFIQDPARTGLKAPAISPTNRWLLRRAGELAGRVLREWLGNQNMPLPERAEAYCVVPSPSSTSGTIDADCAREVCQGFSDATANQPVLLTAGGKTVAPQACLVPPPALYSVWNASQLLACFGRDEQYLLAGGVSPERHSVLEKWGWIKPLSAEEVLGRLRSGEHPPKPRNWDCLLNLWTFVYQSVPNDYLGNARRSIRMVPAEGQNSLFAAEEVVRLALNRRLVHEKDWEFLSRFIVVVDSDWLTTLGTESGGTSHSDDHRLKCAKDTLHAVDLAGATPVDSVLARAASRLFAQPQVEVADAIRLTHIMATLKGRASSDLRYFTRDGRLRMTSEALIWDKNGDIEALVPDAWAAAHLLHDDYSGGSASCSREAWADWATSDKSGLRVSILPQKTTKGVSNRWSIEEFLRSRQVEPPSSYPYKRDYFAIHDYDFDACLLKHWGQIAESDPTVWSQVLAILLQDPGFTWLQQAKAVVRQEGNTHSEKLPCDEIPAGWLVRFRTMRCLPNTHGTLREPAELFMRTPSTEPLMHVEPFVRAEYDTPAARPLLKLLGVRDTPSGPEKLLDRIRALATVKSPPLHEIAKWYEAIDRLLARCRETDLIEVRNAFKNGRLILTETSEWASLEEAFLTANEEDVPDAPLVHSSVRELSMWARLGVGERPTVDLVLAWLKRFESGKKLDGDDLKRVRTLSARHPVRIWEECGHWLSLDSTWTPTTSLRFRLTMQGLTKFSELFPKFKAYTADLRMLSSDICDNYPFAAVKNLGSEITYQIADRQCALLRPEKKPWLHALARGLARARLDTETQTNHVRSVANRLATTVWQPFHSLRVMPYIDGTPAGQTQSPDAYWDQETLYVRDCDLVKVFDAVVAELTRAFNHVRVGEVIKACVERDESFVTSYLEGAMTLDPVAAIPEQGVGVRNDEPEKPSWGQTEDNPRLDAESGDFESSDREADPPLPGPTPVMTEQSSDSGVPGNPVANEQMPPLREQAAPREFTPPLMWRFATAKGYHWSEFQQRYANPDGHWFRKCEGSFNWEQYSSGGEVICRYWVSDQCLAGNGIQIAADLWELIKQFPSESALVLEDVDKTPREYRGTDLVRMMETGQLGVFPAKYRLRVL